MTQSVASTRFRLRTPSVGPAGIEPTAQQRRVIEHGAGRLKVLAGPGTGKSATLVESVVDRIARRGVRPEQVLVLTFSRRAAVELVGRITRRLGVTTREPLVRTLHSYAYSLLRAQAVRAGEPAPRLLGAGESDQMVRELLAGQRESGRGSWPESISAALGSPAFAAELRDLMLRTAERGITPRRLAELGRRRRRPEWQAAALFAREYQDVSDLRQGSSGLGAALDQAELTRAALGLLTDDTVLAAEQSKVRRIFVDEYQDVDPAQARLVELLASGADELIVFGDPDQSIYSFRGSDPAALRDIEVEATVYLTASRRLAPAVLSATRAVADRLPGVLAHRALTTVDETAVQNTAVHETPCTGTMGVQDASDGVLHGLPAQGEVIVRTLPTPAREAAFIADELRRAHLRAGVPWSEMAVLLRSPVHGLPALRRAFAAAGVPLAVSGQDSALTTDPVVGQLLDVLRFGQFPAEFTGRAAVELLGSPAGGMDGDGLRRLRRHLRVAQPAAGSTPDLLADALMGAPLPADLSSDLARPVLRLRSMLEAARAAASDADAETGLWRIWRESGLEDSLVAAALRGGRAGQRADSTLDAVLALFAMAANLADRMPLAGVEAFLDLVQGQRISGDHAVGAARSTDAVAVLSAHAAKGLEWEVVCLAGVAEGCWPVLHSRQGLLGTREVLDAADGLPPVILDGSAAVQEERRLFYVAATRARRRLIATCVADSDTLPSRFLYELAGSEDELPTGWPAEIDGSERRGLHLTDLVAELRRVVADPTVPERTSDLAAAQLARLAAAGVPGAHPQEWYGLADRSSDARPVPDGAPVVVSPSAVDSLTTCALRGVLERRGARGTSSQQQIEGIVLHALVDGLAKGVARVDLVGEMERFLALQTHVPPWLLARSRRALEAMLTAAESWVRDLPADRSLAGSEVQVSVVVPPDGNQEGNGDHHDADLPPGRARGARLSGVQQPRTVLLRGRADRLDRTLDGSMVVVDFKTGATVPSKAAVAENAQLAVYQLAIALGGAGGLTGIEPPRSGSPQIGAEDPAGGAPTSAAEQWATAEQPNADLQQDIRPVDRLPRAGGAELVYLRSGTPQIRYQPPLDAAAAATWRTRVRLAAERLASSSSEAQENRYCERCPVRSSCPLQPEGRQVTR